jgi:microsomal dipeptidase-like Zn-dependent dipeptidase
MSDRIADMHVHPGMKGFNNQGQPGSEGRTIWDAFPERQTELKQLNKAIRGAVAELAKGSQANLDACVKGGLVVPFVSITPPERPMFAINPQKPFRNLIKLLLPKKKYLPLGVAVTAFPPSKIQGILNRVENDRGVDYYREEYLPEKQYILEQQRESSRTCPNSTFGLARDYEHFQSLIDSGHTVVGVLTVEGAHSFGNYLHQKTFETEYKDLKPEDLQELRQSLLRNIQAEKNHEYAPFFVTLMHHFNNLLGGHSCSMSPKSPLIGGLGWPYLPGMRHIFNQKTGMRKGLTPLGREVVDLLLDKTQGKRILIDTKHMSIKVRKEFYELVRRKRVEEDDPIPIICSHAAVNGIGTLDQAEQPQYDEKVSLDDLAYFSRWRINLTDEDIVETFDSDGLIGLVLHEGRVPGGAFKRMTKKLKKRIKKLEGKSHKKEELQAVQDELRDKYLGLIWSNAFHIVKVIRDQRGADGWGLLALGSDYDGLINPYDNWKEVSSFADLKRDMLEYLIEQKPLHFVRDGQPIPISDAERERLLGGHTPPEILDRIFFRNVDRFLSEYFTEDYLL